MPRTPPKGRRALPRDPKRSQAPPDVPWRSQTSPGAPRSAGGRKTKKKPRATHNSYNETGPFRPPAPTSIVGGRKALSPRAQAARYPAIQTARPVGSHGAERVPSYEMGI